MLKNNNRLVVIVSFGALIIIYSIMSVFLFKNAKVLNKHFEYDYKDSLEERRHAEKAYIKMLNIQKNTRDLLLIDSNFNAKEIYTLEKLCKDLKYNLSIIKRTEKNQYNLNNIIQEYNEWQSITYDVIQYIKNQKIAQAKLIIYKESSPKLEVIIEKIQKLIEFENKQVEKAFEEYERRSTNYRAFIIFSTCIVIACAVAIAYYTNDKFMVFEKELFKEKEELRTTIDSIGDGVVVTNLCKKITRLNRVAEKLTGWKEEDALGKKFKEVVEILNGNSNIEVSCCIDVVNYTNKIYTQSGNLILKNKNGNSINISQTAAPIKNIKGNTTGFVISFRDDTERKKKEQEIEFISYHDKITGLYNRAYYEKEKIRMNRDKFLPLSVIIGDINGLKLINDAFGHAEGDIFLMEAGKLLKKCCRKDDVVSRTGGDEFAILLPNTGQDQVTEILNRIEKEIKNYEKEKVNNTYFISIALGAGTKTLKDEKLDVIIKNAEDLMYKRKLLENKSLHNSVLVSIRTTLGEKSHETEAHANRIIENSKLLGKEIGIQKDYFFELELLATLHDVGKIGIPDQILNKPDKLTEDEWIEMKKHPEIGYRIANVSPDLRIIANYILCHHERWDGKGYPQGLAGNEIPLLSRIIAVVDAYDAMTEDRTYRKAKSKKSALEEIRMNAGTQFDPEIAITFVRIMECIEEDT